ncbi:MAG: DUF402 domain-containing protein [Chloroflexota bacterium]
MSQTPTEEGIARSGSTLPGDVVTVMALRSDGNPYRWWKAQVESVSNGRIVTVSRVDEPVQGPSGGWVHTHDTRTIYWFKRPYNLSEVYEPSGRLKQIYIHIASPPALRGDEILYTDHELDVVRRPGHPIRVLDEDEFSVAARHYGYSPAFQASCRKAVEEARRLARHWTPLGPPRRGA